MNENIQKLYSKVLHESSERWNHPDAEKFAELIVRECADVIGCNSHVSGFSLGDLIKQHFGVER